MRPQDIIEVKRDGKELSKDQIYSFVRGVCSSEWADYQISALVMAMFIRGLSDDERDALTNAMVETGETFDLSDVPLPKCDKHSTGGVGDKTSLIIAPLAAACGLAVPMISGRGLGHTGGTLDKLEAIKGYNVRVTPAEMRDIIDECGFVMMGQTDRIAPADRKLYALRDATATVPYIPLIVASIMSKKMAEGLDVLVLDVKSGSGAFMPAIEDAEKLAAALAATGRRFGVKTQAVISDMSQPLGRFVGNAHEVYECLCVLNGDVIAGSEATRELSIDLTARMVELAGIAADANAARTLVEEKLRSGEALASFRRNIRLQGGDESVCDDPRSILSGGLYEQEVTASEDGFIGSVETNAVGNAVVRLGGGRRIAEDSVDHAVGFECFKALGDAVERGEPIGKLYARTANDAEAVENLVRNAYKITPQPPEKGELIRSVI